MSSNVSVDSTINLQFGHSCSFFKVVLERCLTSKQAAHHHLSCHSPGCVHSALECHSWEPHCPEFDWQSQDPKQGLGKTGSSFCAWIQA